MGEAPHSNDLAIQSAAQDRLGRGQFVENLVRALIDDSGRATGVVIAITGDWGSGKSSILNMVGEKLRSRHPEGLILKYEPWITAGLHSQVESFLAELQASVDREVARAEKGLRKRLSELKALAQKLAAYDAVILGASEAYAAVEPQTGIIARLAAKGAAFLLRAFTKKSRLPLVEMRDQVKVGIRQFGQPITVLIDEIDRLADEDIRSMAQLVKAAAHFEEIAFVLAYDPKRVAEALGTTDAERGRRYLEKIVQLEVPLPYLHPDQSQFLFNDRLSEVAENLSLPNGWRDDPDYQQLLGIVIPLLISTPRDINRAVNGFSIRQRMVGKDVYWVDTLAFGILELKNPKISESISRQPWFAALHAPHIPLYGTEAEIWSLLGSNTKLSDFARKELDIDGAAGAACERLCYFLFPHLHPSSQAAKRSDHPDRISGHRPLLTLLALGLPEGSVSYEEILAATRMASQELTQHLTDLVRAGAVLQFVDRFAEVHPRLREDEWRYIWQTLGAVLDLPLRDSTADREFLFLHLPNRLNPMWREAVRRDKNLFRSTQSLVEQLMVQGSTELLCSILLPWAYDLGLFGAQPRVVPQDIPLSAHLIKSYAEQVGSRIATQFLRKDALLGMRGTYPLVLVVRTNNWTELHRLTLAKHLESFEVLDALVVLMFGESYTADDDLISQLVDLAFFKDRVRSRINALPLSDAPNVVRYAYIKCGGVRAPHDMATVLSP